ncbi:MAG TPA: isochorismate synthase [Streptosporangiaceae bacterium]|nr:isochorismate synthase [Streptosporangiaceae bacterium]
MTPDRLVVRTVPVDDPGDLIARLPDARPLAWVRGGDGLVGWGETARISLPAGEDRFTAAEKWLAELFDGAEVTDEVGLPGCGPVAFGSFTFDPTSDGSVLVVPGCVLGRAGGRAWLTSMASDQRAGRAEQAGLAGIPQDSTPAPLTELRWHDGSLTPPKWQQAVSAAVTRIQAGELSKVVLARDLYATASDDIDVRTLLARLAARYPDCWTFCCSGLVGATPELYIRRVGPDVRSLVLAGTTPRGRNAAQDEQLGAALLASAKDVEEHRYTVADVRRALAPLCDRLDVDEEPWLLRLANLQHLATGVTGRLAASRPGAGTAGLGEHASALALAAALHPTPAVCGTPTGTAMELVRELEGMDRGRYAGPVGWVDARGNGEWGIALRCAELDGPRARLFAGCGIVADSDPVTELAETQVKLRPMHDALEG